MTRDDTLWKSILEDMIVYFLRFFYQETEQLFDLTKKIKFLDKELDQISMEAELESPKFVDKLVMVYTKEGEEKWILVHIEVQGYIDPGFEERLFIYYYRIFDRHRKRIATMVIFSDESKTYHPTQYRSEFLGTKILFQFKTYKILDQDEAELNRSENPFAFVILTVLLALKKKRKRGEEDLLRLKIELTKNLLDRQFSKPVIKGLYLFIRNYVVFEEAENNRKFDSTIDSITDKHKTMGIVEVIREREKKAIHEAGIELGREQGIEQGREQGKADIVKNMLLSSKLTVAKIAELAGVTQAFVNNIKKSLN